ncbi:hypothetical protein M3182_08165 [Mesobacillus maritimus]|uniref:hypothetical protein n=1 Tax=Mesobacillus maritimus TaxID=1643336 RepID=UPI00203A7438|nr:hypothetical protein [Mesobacillus maritimus]MCM3585724.1 hypothetical protein [Mesobacillus maritimus]MCM3670479.1 hypothetical protein [Mesobacillus maritimus]
MAIRLICLELRRLTDEYYNCNHTETKELIYSDIKLLSKALFLSDLPEEDHE